MKVESIYLMATELVDTNSKNQVSLERPRFVLFYNKAQKEYLSQLVRLASKDDVVQKAQRFLVQQALKQAPAPGNGTQQVFTLPDNLLKREEVMVTATKGSCTASIVTTEVKPSEVSYILADADTKPSFEYRESIYYIGADAVNIFNDGTFKIEDVNLLYYREPVNIDISGYETEFGKPSKTVETEWEDTEIYEILEILVQRYVVAKLPVKEAER